MEKTSQAFLYFSDIYHKTQKVVELRKKRDKLHLAASEQALHVIESVMGKMEELDLVRVGDLKLDQIKAAAIRIYNFIHRDELIQQANGMTELAQERMLGEIPTELPIEDIELSDQLPRKLNDVLDEEIREAEYLTSIANRRGFLVDTDPTS